MRAAGRTSALLRAAVWTSAPVRARRSAYLRYCARVGARVCAPARAERLLHEKRTFSRRGPDKRPCAPPAEPRTPAKPRAPLRAERLLEKRALRAAGFDEHPLFTPGEREFAGKMPQNAPKCPPEMRRCLTKRVFAYYNYKNGSIWIYCSCPPNYVYARSKTGSWGVWAGFVRCLVFCLDLGFRH